MSDDCDEERQLALAVALSLGRQPETLSASSAGRPKVIDLCSDEESPASKPQSPQKRTEGRTAVRPDGQPAAGSRYVQEGSHGKFGQETDESASESLYSLPENDSLGRFSRDTRQTTSTGASSFLQRMDRRAMEEARLARKRKAPVSPPPGRAVKTARQAISPDIDPSSSPSKHAPAMRGASTPEGLGVQYPRGVVKKTWVRGYQRDGDVKFEEVLQKV